MTDETDFKTPIEGTPFHIEDSFDMSLDSGHKPSYETTSIPLAVDGEDGKLHVSLYQDFVYVSAFFGTERWGEPISDCVVVDGVRYSVSLRCEPQPLRDFDLASAIGSQISFSMSNLDERGRMGMSLQVDKNDPVYVATRDRLAPAARRVLTDFSRSHPSFSEGFRRAVGRREIARLREEQAAAWNEMRERAARIREHMKFVPEELDKLPKEPAGSVSCEETGVAAMRIEKEIDGFSGTAIETMRIKAWPEGVRLSVDLIDGTHENHDHHT